MKKSLSIILSLVMLMTMLTSLAAIAPTVATAVTKLDYSKNVYYVTSFEQLQEQLESSSPECKTIILEDNICPDDPNGNYLINVKCLKDVAIDMNGHNIVINSENTGTLFQMDNPTTLRFINSKKNVKTGVYLYTNGKCSYFPSIEIFNMSNHDADVYTYNVDFSINSKPQNYSFINEENQDGSIFETRGGSIYICGGKFNNYYKHGSVIRYSAEASSIELSVGGNAYLESGWSPIIISDNAPQTVSLYDCTLIASNYCNKARIYSSTSGTKVKFIDVAGENKAVSGKISAVYNYASGKSISSSNIINSELNNIYFESSVNPTDYQSSLVGIIYPTGHMYIDFETESFAEFVPHYLISEDNEIEPSCTEEGKEADKTCPCGYFEEGKEIPKYSHNYEPEHFAYVKQTATPSRYGVYCDPCIDCSYVKESIIPKIDSVKLDKKTYTYTGKTIKPKVKVYDVKGNKINSAHYKVTYPKSSKAIGKYKVTVKFIDASLASDGYIKHLFSGSLTKSYTIAPKGTKIAKFTPAKKAMKLTWNKQTKNTTGYLIKYTDPDGKSKTVTISSNKTTSTTIKNLKADTEYSFSVATYKKVGKTKYASAWSTYIYATTK